MNEALNTLKEAVDTRNALAVAKDDKSRSHGERYNDHVKWRMACIAVEAAFANYSAARKG